MARYNFAANLQAKSPVQTILDRQSQRDAHEINQLNIEAQKIRQPYIQQLLEGQIAQEERAAERWEIEKDFYKEQLEQEQDERANQLELQGYAIKEQEQLNAFREAKQSELYTDEELLTRFPIVGQKWYANQLDLKNAMFDSVNDALARIKAVPADQQDAVYQQIMENVPDQYRGQFPENYDPELMDAYLDYINKDQKIREEALMQMWSEAMDRYNRNPTEENRREVALIESMIERSGGYGAGRGTAGERYAESVFGWAENPLAAAEEYERLSGQIKYEQRRLVAERLARDDFSDAMGRVDMYRLRTEYPDQYAAYMQEVYASAIASLEEDDRDWYLQAAQQIEEARQAKRSPTTPAPEAVPEGTPEPAPEPPSVNRESTIQTPVVPQTNEGEYDLRGLSGSELKEAILNIPDGAKVIGPDGDTYIKGTPAVKPPKEDGWWNRRGIGANQGPIYDEEWAESLNKR